MFPRPRSHRRLVLPVVLSLILAAETIAVVAAVGVPAGNPSAEGLPATVVAPFTLARGAESPASLRLETRRVAASGNPNLPPDEFLPAPAPEPPATVGVEVLRPQPAQPVARVKSISKSAPAARTTAGSRSGSGQSYSGRNKMWMPALGINRSVSYFACTSKAYPGDRVYRWGCAGRNNIYLFGHAHSVFKPLHDAYVRGRLKKGMKVTYADGNGTVRTYQIAWWKVTTPEKGEFAFAAQSRPSMTLQTCVGSKSQYRLIVRLVLSS